MATPHPSTASLRSGCHLPLKVKALSNIIAKNGGSKPPVLPRKCLFYTFIHHFLANIKLRSILPYKIDLNFLFCIQIFPKGVVWGEDNEIFFSALLADKDADLGGIYVGAIVKAFAPVFFCRLF